MNNILVIEDDLNIRESISELLNHKKYHVITAKDGDEGMLLAKQGQPDLIICDVMMPGTDGHHVLKAIRSDDALANTPFVFLTAKAQHDDVREGMKLGADDYLIKPFKAKDLFDAVESRLTRLNQVKKEYAQKLKVIKPLEQKLIKQGLETPLQGIVEFSKMLLTHFDSYSKEEIQNFIKRISTSAFNLNKKITNIILFQSLEKAKYDKTTRKSLSSGSCKIKDEVVRKKLVEVSVAHGRDMDVFIHLIEDKKVNISEQNLIYVLQELFDNAFKFSNKGDLIEVQGSISGDYYELNIENKGNAINTDHQNEHTHKNVGPELGLNVTSRLMELNDGRIKLSRVDSDKNRVLVQIKI